MIAHGEMRHGTMDGSDEAGLSTTWRCGTLGAIETGGTDLGVDAGLSMLNLR